MKPLQPNQEAEAQGAKAKSPKAKSTIFVMVTAEFPNITPAHARYITKQGEGSNLSRAVRDAVANVFADPRLRGKRAASTLPAKMTVQFNRQGEE
jgi:hypothetical protein